MPAGQLDSDLAEIIAAWPSLDAGARGEVLAVVRALARDADRRV